MCAGTDKAILVRKRLARARLGARSRNQWASCWQSDVNDPSSEKVVASVPACLLAASNFHEIVRVHVDQYGHIRALWYQTMATVCPEGKPSLPAAPVQLVSLSMPLIPRFLLHCTQLPPGALVSFVCRLGCARTLLSLRPGPTAGDKRECGHGEQGAQGADRAGAKNGARGARKGKAATAGRRQLHPEVLVLHACRRAAVERPGRRRGTQGRRRWWRRKALKIADAVALLYPCGLEVRLGLTVKKLCQSIGVSSGRSLLARRAVGQETHSSPILLGGPGHAPSLHAATVQIRRRWHTPKPGSPPSATCSNLEPRIWSPDSGKASNRETPATTRTRGGAAGGWGGSETWETSWLSVLLPRPRPGVALPLRNHVSG